MGDLTRVSECYLCRGVHTYCGVPGCPCGGSGGPFRDRGRVCDACNRAVCAEHSWISVVYGIETVGCDECSKP